jgi:hypothetical protein
VDDPQSADRLRFPHVPLKKGNMGKCSPSPTSPQGQQQQTTYVLLKSDNFTCYRQVIYSTIGCCSDRVMADEKTKKKPPNKIFVTLPDGARQLFDQLVSRKFYGTGNSEVARHLIIVRLDELVEAGRLTEPPPNK